VIDHVEKANDLLPTCKEFRKAFFIEKYGREITAM